jgi:hypothetical protein
LAGDAGREDGLDGIERRRLAALVACDFELARAMHADDYELITPGGRTMSKDEYLGDLETGEMRYDVFEAASPIRTRVVGAAGLVRYQARIRARFGDQLDTGVFWHTDYYEQRDGRWQAVWSHATRIRRPPEDEA